MAADRLRIGIVGCGDVAARHYLPALADMAGDVRIATFDALDAMLGAGGLDAVIDLAPAPRHATVNQAILDAGLHLYSEKPIANTVAEADRLIATATDRGVTFLCAPGVAATRRVRWLKELVDSGRYGHATLVVAHHADPGPAAWREYTGDPRPFYGPGVGPVIDHGVYRLHAMTALLGPVTRVQAMGEALDIILPFLASLTPEQRAELKELMEERRDRRRGWGWGWGHGSHHMGWAN